MEQQFPFQVKYTIRYTNGNPDKEGRFPLATDDPADPAILKTIVAREPGLDNVDYILGRILAVQEPDPDQGHTTNPIFSFTGLEIRQYLENL